MAGHGFWLVPSYLASLWIYIIALVLLAYAVSSTCRFYIKFVFLMIYYFTISSLVILLSLWSPGSKNNVHRASRFLNWTQKLLGIKYNVKGLENYKKDSNYIIVSNHQSSFDMNVVHNFMPPKTTVMVKKDSLYVPFIGFMFWICGVFFVDRHRHSEAMNTMKKAAEQIKKEKVVICCIKYQLCWWVCKRGRIGCDGAWVMCPSRASKRCPVCYVLQLLSNCALYCHRVCFRPRLHEPGMIFSPGW